MTLWVGALMPTKLLAPGDVLEIVTLVGGGSGVPAAPPFPPLRLERTRSGAAFRRHGQVCHARPDARLPGGQRSREVVTVAVRRERLFDRQGRNLLDYVDPRRYTILPNTAGCFSAEEALRTARLGRELLQGLNNPGADWVKLEVLADTRTLLPDPVATLEATRVLVEEGFHVLCYTSDDPIMARRLKEAGARQRDAGRQPDRQRPGRSEPQQHPDHPRGSQSRRSRLSVIVDAGVGTASDVAIAMELGCDGVLLNTGIAGASDPLRMAHAMRLAIEAGWLAAGAGRISKKLYATASSPTQGMVGAN